MEYAMNVFLTYPIQGMNGEFRQLILAIRNELRRMAQAVASCSLTAHLENEDSSGDLNPAKTSDLMLVVSPVKGEPVITERMQMEIQARVDEQKPTLILLICEFSDLYLNYLIQLIKDVLQKFCAQK